MSVRAGAPRHGQASDEGTRPFSGSNGEWYEIEAEELLARCIMHETDHLDGQLYVDIMSRELFDEDDPQDEETEDSKA